MLCICKFVILSVFVLLIYFLIKIGYITLLINWWSIIIVMYISVMLIKLFVLIIAYKLFV